MKYNIQISGHSETIDLNKHDDGTVDGTITSPEGGVGSVHGSWSDDGNMDGAIELAGQQAKFTATVRGNSITGAIKVKVGWIWIPGPSFAGQEVA